MRTSYFIILLGLFIVLLSSPVLADLTANNIVYYSFDNDNISGSNPIDLTGNGNNGTTTGATTGKAGLIDESFNFDGTNDYVTVPNLGIGGTTPRTISLWFNSTNIDLYPIFSYGGSTAGTAYELAMQSNTSLRLSYKNYYHTITYNAGLYIGDWVHIVAVTNGSTAFDTSIYVNGVLQNRTGGVDGTINTGDTAYYIARLTTNYWGNGDIDEFSVWDKALSAEEVTELYGEGAGNQYPYPLPASTNASERLQQNSKIYQNATVTVNSLTYVPITSSSITLSADALVYVTAPVVIEPTASNSAQCRITLDGAEFGSSEKTRSLTAGETAVMLLNSYSENLSSGSHDIGLECKRTGGGKFDVIQSVLNANIMKSADGDALQYNNYTLNGTVGTLYTNNFNTSDNATVAGLERSIVLEMSMQISYSATGNITFTPEIAGQNCTAITRYGTSGSTGSSAAVCAVSGVDNNTQYDYKIHSSGVSATYTGVANLKEFINHPKEVNSTSLNGISITGTNQSLASIDITVAGGHSSPNIITEAIIDVISTNGTQTPVFYISHEGENSINVSRTVNEGQAGTLGLEQLFQTASGTETSTLYGSCFGCQLQGGDMIAFLSGDVAATPNEFTVNVQNIYDNSTAINTFNITLSDGRSFATTTGSINVPSTGEIYNITLAEDGNSDIPHYSTTINTHNGTFDLTINATPYTVINATYGGAVVNNFTANGTSTTDGTVYLRLFNATFEINITEAIANDGTNLSDASANITSSPYLESYTFALLTSNVFNFSIYDEITEALITQNMTIELITTNSAQTYTTTNGTLYLELLTPTDYTIRYKTTDNSTYPERDYYQTLTDRQRYPIDLYSLLSSEGTDMVVTIKDTGGDPVEGATVKLLRYYSSCNCYKVVEMSKTSNAGEAYFITDAYDGHYKFSVDYLSLNRFLSTTSENFIPVSGLIERTITINLGSAYFQSFRELSNVGRTLTYNNITGGLSFTWSDPEGLITRGCLYAETLNGVHYVAETPVCETSSTGSVVMSLNTTKKYKYYAEVETSTDYSEYVLFSGTIDTAITNLFTDVKFGGFFGGIIVIFMALIFSFSAIGVMISVSLSLLIMNFLFAFSFATTFITGITALILGMALFGMRR